MNIASLRETISRKDAKKQKEDLLFECVDNGYKFINDK